MRQVEETRLLAQRGLALPRGLFGPLAILDVRDDAKPSQNRSLLVPQRDGARQKPAKLSIRGASEPHFILHRLPGTHRSTPLLRVPLEIVGVNHLAAPPR